MISGCFIWIIDFDQLVGVKRINIEWIYFQVRVEVLVVVKYFRKRWDIFLDVFLENLLVLRYFGRLSMGLLSI